MLWSKLTSQLNLVLRSKSHHLQQVAKHSTVSKSDKFVNINFVKRGKLYESKAALGSNLMETAMSLNQDLIEGACEGSLACSTCHIILEPSHFDRLEPATEIEEDLLDLAPYLTDTSRLGCQIKVTEDMEGMTVEIPPYSINITN